MKVAIMQPYFFPYIGYFQLINAVDLFIFYDDVNFPKKGWVNRNRILCNGKEFLITVPLKNASQNKLINDIEIDDRNLKLLKIIEFSYLKAPYFHLVYPIIERILNSKNVKISDLSIQSIVSVSEYLDIETNFLLSSKNFSDTVDLKKADRLIEISKLVKSNTYINAIGGQALYHKEIFAREGIELKFIESLPIEYNQFGNIFIPFLSIIDILMFNCKANVKLMLDKYVLK